LVGLLRGLLVGGAIVGKVWIVMQHWPYDDTEILGVYGDYQSAECHMATAKSNLPAGSSRIIFVDEYEVREWEGGQ
jgi:hypothetical protein